MFHPITTADPSRCDSTVARRPVGTDPLAPTSICPIGCHHDEGSSSRVPNPGLRGSARRRRGEGRRRRRRSACRMRASRVTWLYAMPRGSRTSRVEPGGDGGALRESSAITTSAAQFLLAVIGRHRRRLPMGLRGRRPSVPLGLLRALILSPTAIPTYQSAHSRPGLCQPTAASLSCSPCCWGWGIDGLRP